MAEIGVISLEEIKAPFKHYMSAHRDDKKAIRYPRKVQSLLVDALHYPHDAIDSLDTLTKNPRNKVSDLQHRGRARKGPWSYEDVNIAIQLLGVVDEHQYNQSLHAAQGTRDQIFQCGLGFSTIMGLFNRIVAEIPESYANQVTGPLTAICFCR